MEKKRKKKSRYGIMSGPVARRFSEIVTGEGKDSEGFFSSSKGRKIINRELTVRRLKRKKDKSHLQMRGLLGGSN